MTATTISPLKELLDRQRDFFESNTTRDVDYRIKQLKKLKKALQVNEQEIYTALYTDFKKSAFETYAPLS